MLYVRLPLMSVFCLAQWIALVQVLLLVSSAAAHAAFEFVRSVSERVLGAASNRHSVIAKPFLYKYAVI